MPVFVFPIGQGRANGLYFRWLKEEYSDMETPIRDTFWNVPVVWQVALYLSMAAATAYLTYRLLQHVRLWRRGQPELRTDHLGLRVGRLLRFTVAQVGVARERYPALMHLSMFWGFIILFIGTVLATVDYDITLPFFGYKLLKGNFYLAYELILDLLGATLFIVLGLALASYRRFITRPDKLTHDWRFTAVLAVFWYLNFTGLLVEGFRLAVVKPWWATWSPVGYAIGQFFLALGLNESTLRGLHLGTWVIHFLGVGIFIVLIPHTNLVHIFTAPLNVFFSSLESRGALKPIPNIEEAEVLGVGQINQFTWKQRLDFEACTECGRCQVACPAWMADQPLSPKKLILDLRDHMLAQADSQSHGDLPPLVGGIILDETLWACTSCRACMEECPVLIEQVPAIIDMRRHLVLTEGRIPEQVAGALRRVESSGNPWGMSRGDRTAWAEGLGVRRLADVGQVDVLYWVGCAGAYDPRNQKVSRAFVKILQAAEVDFAILGEEEQCTGDAARRAGNEYLFQMLAQANIETLSQYKFRRIVTQCPHCFNTLKNEYPQFGGRYEVIHHSRFIAELLAQGKIKPTTETAEAFTYHDPCYLGRYNGEYDAPRQVIVASGARLTEMARSRQKGLCCGGGGARVWMEDRGKKRVNWIRADEIAATGAATVGVSCPFCMIMLEDGTRARGHGDRVVVKDIAEIVAARLPSPETT